MFCAALNLSTSKPCKMPTGNGGSVAFDGYVYYLCVRHTNRKDVFGPADLNPKRRTKMITNEEEIMDNNQQELNFEQQFIKKEEEAMSKTINDITVTVRTIVAKRGNKWIFNQDDNMRLRFESRAAFKQVARKWLGENKHVIAYVARDGNEQLVVPQNGPAHFLPRNEFVTPDKPVTSGTVKTDDLVGICGKCSHWVKDEDTGKNIRVQVKHTIAEMRECSKVSK